MKKYKKKINYKFNKYKNILNNFSLKMKKKMN